MAKYEIELDDKGDFLGSVPQEVVAVLERLKATAHGEGFGKGNQKAAEEAKAQIASTVAAEKAKWEAQLPIERAKWADIEQLNTHLKTQLDASTAEHRKTLTAREEAHAADITRRADLETKLTSKIKTLVNDTLKALASRFGARDESLSELEIVLQHRIDYSDPTNPKVLGEDGKPATTTAGNPLGLDVFVKQYLDGHPHHKKAPQGQGGGARGGASLHGQQPASLDAARARVDGGDRSNDAIDSLFQAGRRKAAS